MHKLKDCKRNNSKLTYQRIKIEARYPDKKTRSFSNRIPIFFQFGVCKRNDPKTKDLSGYTLPVCLWAKDQNPSANEIAFHNAIKDITNIAREHLEEAYGPELANDLKDPLYYKKVEYTDKKGKTKDKNR